MTTFLALHVLIPLAQKPPDPKDVKQGWLGFAVFIALAAAVVLLWLSMRRQLRKVDFVEEPDRPGARPRRAPRMVIPSAPDTAPGDHPSGASGDTAADRPDRRT